MKRAIVLLLLVGLFVPVAAFAEAVKLGFINSITGPEAPIGENLTNGVILAVEDLKKKGIDVELVKEDDTAKPDKSMAAFEKLATRDKVLGVVGPYTSATANADAKVAERYKVPMIVPAASKEEITRQNLQWTYRVSGTTGDYAGVLLDLATAALAVCHSTSTICQSSLTARYCPATQACASFCASITSRYEPPLLFNCTRTVTLVSSASCRTEKLPPAGIVTELGSR